MLFCLLVVFILVGFWVIGFGGLSAFIVDRLGRFVWVYVICLGLDLI